jgi:hypothetical protein
METQVTEGPALDRCEGLIRQVKGAGNVMVGVSYLREPARVLRQTGAEIFQGPRGTDLEAGRDQFDGQGQMSAQLDDPAGCSDVGSAVLASEAAEQGNGVRCGHYVK